MAILYTNYKGKPVTAHSYSAGADFHKCKKYYQLKRIKGWRTKEDKASMRFGTALESAIQYFHSNELRPGATAEEFIRLWTKVREIPNLVYTDKEGSWEAMLQMGTEMAKLYEVKLPNLPIRNPKFQLNYRKPLYPGTYLDGLEVTAYVDMLVPEPALLIDIKTTGASFDTTPGIMALDPQLRMYSWLSGVPNVAFMTFVKVTLSPYKKGDAVTLIHDGGSGDELVVAINDTEKNLVWALTPDNYTEFDAATKGVKGKALDAIKNSVQEKFEAVSLDYSWITKQRLQFLQSTISEEDRRETGEEVGRQVAEIYSHNEKNYWPKQPGVRFPDTKCAMCDMLPICLDNKKQIEETLVQLRPEPDKANEKDWLEELVED
jgi:hypothetical protein